MMPVERLFAALLAIAFSASGEVGLRNADFESFDADGKPVGWYVPSKFRVERGAGSNGSSGLVYDNPTDDAYYEIAAQRLDLVRGASYRYGAWVMVDEISGRGGVAVILSWYSEKGKWIGESQTALIRRATKDWTKSEGLSVVVPANAAYGKIGFVVQRGVTGHVRFDRAYVERHVRRPVVGVYCSAYRAEASDGDVDFAAALTPEAFGVASGKVSVRFEARCADGAAFSVEGRHPVDDEARVTLPVARFALGTNEIDCVLSAAGKEIGRATTRFVRTAAPTPRKVFLDRFGRTVVNGRLFFPLGMYTGRMNAAHLARYADSPFNCLMQYGSPTSADMKAFRDAGVKVIYDIASQYRASDAGTNHVRHAIRKFGGDPAVLAWYLYDEQPTSQIPVLEARQRLVESLDSDHPTWCAQDIFCETRHYLGACDVFGGDPYPVSAKPIALATEAIRTETKGLMGMRPIWQVVQAFGWNWIQDSQAKRQRRPTEAEIRNMAWQALAGGARGLIFYSYGYLCRDMPRRDPVEVLWPELVRIAREIKDHERMLLAVDTEPVPDADLPPGVVGRVWRVDGETWRVLVNTKGETVTAMGCGLSALGVKIDHL